MNATDRAANRILLLVVGLVLLALGAAATAAALVAAVRDPFISAAGDAPAAVSGLLQDTPIAATGTSWLTVALIAVLLLAVVLLVAFVVRQGRGRTSRLVRRSGTTIDTAVAADLLRQALEARTELVSAHVSSYDVRGTPALKIAVTARRGVAPTAVRDTVEQALHGLDAVLGTRVPALLQISGGFRTRLAKADRVQ